MKKTCHFKMNFKCCKHCANFRELVGDPHLEGFCIEGYSPLNLEIYRTNMIVFADVVSCGKFEPIFEQEIDELTGEYQCR